MPLTPDEISKATPILTKTGNSWTRDENKYIYGLIKKGHREELRGLRNQAQLADPIEA